MFKINPRVHPVSRSVAREVESFFFFLPCFHTVLCPAHGHLPLSQRTTLLQENLKALNYVITTLHHVYSLIIVQVCKALSWAYYRYSLCNMALFSYRCIWLNSVMACTVTMLLQASTVELCQCVDSQWFVKLPFCPSALERVRKRTGQ